MLTDAEARVFDRFVEVTQLAAAPSPEAIARYYEERISGPTIRRYWRLAKRGKRPGRFDPNSLDVMRRVVTGYEKEGEAFLRNMAQPNGRPSEAFDSVEINRRLGEILGAANLSRDDKSVLMLDMAIVLRCASSYERDRASVFREQAALVEAEIAAERQAELSVRDGKRQRRRRVSADEAEDRDSSAG